MEYFNKVVRVPGTWKGEVMIEYRHSLLALVHDHAHQIEEKRTLCLLGGGGIKRGLLAALLTEEQRAGRSSA